MRLHRSWEESSTSQVGRCGTFSFDWWGNLWGQRRSSQMSNQFPYPSNQNDGRDQTKPETEKFQKQLSVFNFELCLTLQGLVTIQTTIRNNPPKIIILTHVILPQSFATCQVDFFHRKIFWKSDMESFSCGTVYLVPLSEKWCVNHSFTVSVGVQVLSVKIPSFPYFDTRSFGEFSNPLFHLWSHF